MKSVIYDAITKTETVVEFSDLPIIEPTVQPPTPEERIIHVEATQAAIIEVLTGIAGVTL